MGRYKFTEFACSTIDIGMFEILTFEVIMKHSTNDIVSFE